MNDQILNTLIGNSPTIAALIFLINFLIKDTKQKEKERDTKDNQQNMIEKEFRDYVIKQTTEHHNILLKNTEAFEKMISLIDKITLKNTKDV